MPPMLSQVAPPTPKCEVVFSCDQCGVKDVKMLTAARRKGQDVLDWMERLSVHLEYEHSKLSPVCSARSMTQVKIRIVTNDFNMAVVGAANTGEVYCEVCKTTHNLSHLDSSKCPVVDVLVAG